MLKSVYSENHVTFSLRFNDMNGIKIVWIKIKTKFNYIYLISISLYTIRFFKHMKISVCLENYAN